MQTPNHLGRETKLKIASFAETLSYKTEPGKHYGQLTRKDLDVLDALLRLCGASVDPAAIAARAACSKSSVHKAIESLETAGLLTTVRAGRVLKTITLIVPKQSVPVSPWIAAAWEG